MPYLIILCGHILNKNIFIFHNTLQIFFKTLLIQKETCVVSIYFIKLNTEYKTY